MLPFVAGVDAREVLQVLHDLLHAIEAFARLAHQLGNVLLEKVDVALRRIAHALAAQMAHHAEQLADIALQGAEVGIDIADRVVDLVRHPGGELADRCHLLRLHQLRLRRLQLRIHQAHLFVELRQALDTVLLLGMQVGVVDHQRDQRDQRPAARDIVVGERRRIGEPVHRQRTDTPILDRERPADRGARRTLGAFLAVLAGGVVAALELAVDQHRLAALRDLAEHAGAERHRLADHARRQVDAGDDAQLRRLQPIDDREAAALRAEAAHDVTEHRLQRPAFAVARAAELVQLLDERQNGRICSDHRRVIR